MVRAILALSLAAARFGQRPLIVRGTDDFRDAGGDYSPGTRISLYLRRSEAGGQTGASARSSARKGLNRGRAAGQ